LNTYNYVLPCLIKITGDLTIDAPDISGVQGTVQDEFTNLNLSLGATMKIPPDTAGDYEMLDSNSSPDTASPLQLEVAQSLTSVQALTYYRPLP
jgi:hypothetical protein